MVKTNISSLEELKQEISRLNSLKKEQEAYLGNQFVLLKEKIDKPAQILGAITSSIPGVNLIRGFFSKTENSSTGAGKQDWMNRFLRIGMPLLLNRTLLKKSSWLKKSIVLLASETAAGQLTRDGLVKAINKLTNIVKPSHKKRNNRRQDSKANSSTVTNVNIVVPEEEQILGI